MLSEQRRDANDKSADTQEIIIGVNNLSKCFRLYKKPVDRLKEQLLPSKPVLHDTFWALRNVNFDVYKGETLGIIGPNGSGKSTLLEIIAGTQTATEGGLHVDGRVAALLELGAGFNPEFSGRENIYMNAAVMGLTREQTEDRYDDILEFAELGDYINHPVRTYSSGMYVRLAFATAIHMDPEILIVDEALAVGDIRFQRKCFRKFEEFKRDDKTILFVTHATETITTHCDRAVFLNAGEIQTQGDPKSVVHAYLTHMFGGENAITEQQTAGAANPAGRASYRQSLSLDPSENACEKRRHYNPTEYRWGNRQAEIIDFLIVSNGNNGVNDKQHEPVFVTQGCPVEVLLQVYFHDALDDLIYGLTIKTVDGITVYGANTRNKDYTVRARREGEFATIKFALTANLVPGDYFVSCGVAQEDKSVDNLAIDRRYDLFMLSIEGNRDDFGIADLSATCSESDVVVEAESDSDTNTPASETVAAGA